MVRRTGQRGVPVIAVDDDYVVGFDRPRLEQLLARAPRARPVFGAAVADAARVRAKDGDVAAGGAYVGRVSPDSPAARAGLTVGDVILALDGRQVRTADDVQAVLAELAPGAVVSVTYERGGERRSAQTRL